MESKRKLYLPRYYGIEEFGYPSNFKINKGEAITAVGTTAVIEAAYAEGVVGIAT